jgi:hypothetical protein
VAVTGSGFDPRGGFAVAGEPRPAGEIPGLSEVLETGVLANRAAFHDDAGARPRRRLQPGQPGRQGPHRQRAPAPGRDRRHARRRGQRRAGAAPLLVLFTSVVAGLPLALLPLQILWLNLVTDVFPALALAMEPAEPDVMRRPPRHPEAAILSRRLLLLTGSYSVLLAGLAIAVFSWAVWVAQMELERARTLAFMTLALTQLAHVFNARSPRPVLFSRRLFQNRWVWAAIALTVGMQLAVVYVPPLARLLGTRPLAAGDWLLVAACSAITLVLGQLVKARPRRQGRAE